MPAPFSPLFSKPSVLPFSLLIAVLIWLPLFDAGVYPRERALLQIASGIILLLSILLADTTWARHITTGRARWVIGCLLGFQLLGILQLVPLPLVWLEAIAPFSASAWQSTGLLSGAIVSTASVSIDPWSTIDEVISGTAYLALFVSTLMLVNSHRRLGLVLATIIASALFQAVYGSVHFLAGEHIQSAHGIYKNVQMVSGTFENRNHFAAYAGLGLALGLGIILAQMRRTDGKSNLKTKIAGLANFMVSRGMILRLSLAIMVVGVVLSRSRMGNTAFFVSLLVGGLFALRSPVLNRKLIALVIGSILTIDLLVVGAWFGFDQVAKRIEQTSQSATINQRTLEGLAEGHTSLTREQGMQQTAGDHLQAQDATGTAAISPQIPPGEATVTTAGSGSNPFDLLRTEQRDEYVRDSLILIRNNWLLGLGAGTFYTSYPSVRGLDVFNLVDQAHNDYLQFLAESGVVGLALLAIVILITLYTALLVIIRRRSTVPISAALGAIAAITHIVTHISVEFLMQVPADAATFVVILALVFVSERLPSPRKTAWG